MIVLSLGGSIVAGEGLNTPYISEFRRFIDEIERKVFVVVGGGSTARNYISSAKELGFDQYFLDRIGIMATRLNAMLLITPRTYPKVAESVDEAILASSTYKNVVMGGTEPGHTTDAVSLLLAERLGVKDVFNLTSVGGIYDKDPRKHEDARIIRRMSYEDAKKLLAGVKMSAGLNIPLDLVSIKIAERSGIRIHVISKDLEVLRKAIGNEDHEGTVIGEFNP